MTRLSIVNKRSLYVFHTSLSNYDKLGSKKLFRVLIHYMFDNRKIVAVSEGVKKECIDEYHLQKSNIKTIKLEPTLIDNPKRESMVMNEEIFGPILPIIEYENILEAINYIHSYEKPLALYLFTNDKKLENKILSQISFGGGCINDTIIHIANSNMSFGGVGHSGIGGYHGKSSFNTFSHNKSITKKFVLDLPLRYMPYTNWKDKIIKIFMN